MYIRTEKQESVSQSKGKKITTITEMDVHSCDICKDEVFTIYNCKLCNKELCGNCIKYNYCPECFSSNSIAAEVISFINTREVQCGYSCRDEKFKDYKLEFDEYKYSTLLKKFSDKKLKITFEPID
jgi:hypothetical protein